MSTCTDRIQGGSTGGACQGAQMHRAPASPTVARYGGSLGEGFDFRRGAVEGMRHWNVSA